jgi:hypothetical protein
MSKDDNSKIMILALVLGGAYFLTKDKEKKKEDVIPLVEYGPENGTNPPIEISTDAPPKTRAKIIILELSSLLIF